MKLSRPPQLALDVLATPLWMIGSALLAIGLLCFILADWIDGDDHTPEGTCA